MGTLKDLYTKHNTKKGRATAGGILIGGGIGLGLSHLGTKKLRVELASLKLKPKKTPEDLEKIKTLSRKIAAIKIGSTLAGAAATGIVARKYASGKTPEPIESPISKVIVDPIIPSNHEYSPEVKTAFKKLKSQNKEIKSSWKASQEAKNKSLDSIKDRRIEANKEIEEALNRIKSNSKRTNKTKGTNNDTDSLLKTLEGL